MPQLQIGDDVCPTEMGDQLQRQDRKSLRFSKVGHIRMIEVPSCD